ncbi:MAG TPA: hypothetical protein DDY37_07705 [Legionella sp.]|nr:hypothetical protein [Legionella sp.]
MMGTLFPALVLAQLLGLYFLIMAIVLYSRVAFYRRLIQRIDPESGTIVLAASIGLLLGIFFVGVHNVWVWGLGVGLTIICWGILLVSLLWLFAPVRMTLLTQALFLGRRYYFVVAFMALLGVALMSRSASVYVMHLQALALLG